MPPQHSQILAQILSLQVKQGRLEAACVAGYISNGQDSTVNAACK